MIGNVIINGTDEFETTVELVRSEVSGDRPASGPQSIHAWISVGDDTIIDAALAPRLAKYYGAPAQYNDRILIGRADELSKKERLRYQPMVIGSEFFAKTNPPDPMAILEAYEHLFR